MNLVSSDPFKSQKFVSLAMKITVGATRLLSDPARSRTLIILIYIAFRASLTIFTYAAFKILRTVTRQLLVSLSVVDILVHDHLPLHGAVYKLLSFP